MFPDLPDSLLQRGAVQRFQAQARKDFDSIVYLSMDPQKESTLRLLRSCEPHWVRDAPVRRDRLTRPQRTSLSCGLITDRENEIERWAAHARKFIPALATKA